MDKREGLIWLIYFHSLRPKQYVQPPCVIESSGLAAPPAATLTTWVSIMVVMHRGSPVTSVEKGPIAALRGTSRCGLPWSGHCAMGRIEPLGRVTSLRSACEALLRKIRESSPGTLRIMHASHAKLTSEHSSITFGRLALWAAVYSNEVYQTL